MKLSSRPRPSTPRCAVCHGDGTAADTVAPCRSCGVLLHPECLRDLPNGCPTLGCSGARGQPARLRTAAEIAMARYLEAHPLRGDEDAAAAWAAVHEEIIVPLAHAPREYADLERIVRDHLAQRERGESPTREQIMAYFDAERFLAERRGEQEWRRREDEHVARLREQGLFAVKAAIAAALSAIGVLLSLLALRALRAFGGP